VKLEIVVNAEGERRFKLLSPSINGKRHEYIVFLFWSTAFVANVPMPIKNVSGIKFNLLFANFFISFVGKAL
jgi:hypothetical protein